MASREIDPVRVVITDPNVPRSGTLTYDGVPLAVNDPLLYAVPGSAFNGPHRVQTGPWTRREDWNTLAEMLPGNWLTVLEGGNSPETYGHAGSTWYFSNPNPPGTLDVTILNWQMRAMGHVRRFSTDFDVDVVSNMVHLEEIGQGGTSTAATQVRDTKGRIVDVRPGAVQPSFIEDLELVYDGPAAMTLRAGAAWIPALNSALDTDVDIPKTNLVLAANTWYYAYLYENEGVPDWEFVTQAPDFPYQGGARVKGPDTAPDETRRFMGARRVSGVANTLWRTKVGGEKVRYEEDTSVLPFRVLALGTIAGGSGGATVDCSAVVPPTSTEALVRVDNKSNQYARLRHPGNLQWNNYVRPADGWVDWIDLNTLQQFIYGFVAAISSGGLDVDVLGFREEK